MSTGKGGHAVNRGVVKRTIRALPLANLWFLLIISLLFGTSLLLLITFRWNTALATKFTTLANLECKDAVDAFESGGPRKLESVMKGHEAEAGVRAYLFDKNGRNLGGGADLASLLSREPFFSRITNLLTGKPASALSHMWVVPQTSNRECVVATPSFDDVQVYGTRTLGLLAILAVLCYGLVGYVVVRMRRLEVAIRSFGTGELQIRLPSNARGPIRRLSEAFNQMASQVELLVEAHKRLCIDVSHELRSPLTRLKLAIGLARSGTPRALEQIELESTRLGNLVDQLLDVARAEIDPTTLRKEVIDVESFISDLADECRMEAREHGCELELRFEAPGTIVGDAELLRRAVENPLRNAIRHNLARLPVEITCNGNAEFAAISIRDRGPGVPDSALQEIFKPFYRVESDRDRDTGGSGLGLAIAERAILLHRGSILAENVAPGLRIDIRLPRH
jgi:two-component system sensor histidine kinase CpxA